MSFLFKSSKSKQSGLPQASRNLQSADGTASAASGSYRDSERQRNGVNAPPNPPFAQSGSMNPPDSPGQRGARDRSNSDMTSQIPRGLNTPPPQPHQKQQLAQRPQDSSLFPWSKREVELINPQQTPFPRYGAAVNSVASKDGEIYMMGGLINGSTVKGDLWICEAAGHADVKCYAVPTTAEGPGPRVGHASLLVGNAFIVFGGDTKIDEGDVLDDTLYLLNTSSKHWSRAIPSGQRPQGRYGHTLNIIGTKIYIFGGQVENYFFNDLVAFDLNTLQLPNNRWETLVQNSNDGGLPVGQIPFARTNHSIVTYNEKLFLFGGTDGERWFNDVWVYDARTNLWELQECIGFIPIAREGHAAALVGDVMYVFGGRNEEGKDLNDLTAFRIPTRRWYTFQNMGPAPSPRSGHGMTAVGSSIYILGGEPSSSPRDAVELGQAYVLDTSKIRYPASDKPGQPSGGALPQRKTSLDRSGTPQQRADSAQGHVNGRLQSQDSQENMAAAQNQQEPYANNMYGSRMSRGAPGPPPPQQQPPQPRVNGVRPIANNISEGGRESPRQMQLPERITSQDPSQPQYGREPPRVSSRDIAKDTVQAVSSGIPVRQRATSAAQPGPPQQQPPQQPQPQQQAPQPLQPRPQQQTQPQAQPLQQKTIDDIPVTQLEGNSRISNDYATKDTEAQRGRPQQAAQQAVTQQTAASSKMESDHGLPMPGQFPVDSGVGSSPSLSHQHHDELLKELESIRSQNAWYASELTLAKKSGYRTGGSDSPEFNGRLSAPVADSDKPLLEALLRVKAELVQAQQSMQAQTDETAERIAFLERQRDAAINEAVYARNTSAGRGEDRSRDAASDERLASALSTHSDLSTKLKGLGAELDAERKAREHAEQSANAAHQRASELDTHKQTISSEIERLRMQVHEVEKLHRQEATNAHEAQSALKKLQADHGDLNSKWTQQQVDTQHHATVMDTLRTAVTSSTEKTGLLEKQLDEERRQKRELEEQITKIRADHDARLTEVGSLQKRIQDVENLAASHAEEAKTHREAVLAGFGTSVTSGPGSGANADERVAALQERLDAANDLVRRNQEAADQAADKLRSAEERISGLEAYQEQASREGLSMRKQLQQFSSDAAALQSKHAEVQQQLTNKELEHSALQTQHSMLSQILNDQGIDTSDLSDARGPTADRIRELEARLEENVKAHEELRSSFVEREREANKGWEEKLANLDNDYQSAVKYLKGTEKMLSKMKQELHRYKTQNKDLEDELATRDQNSKEAPSSWEAERTSLKKEIEDMQARIDASRTELDRHMDAVSSAHAERDYLLKQLESASKESRADMESLRSQNSALESRAAEAERKVQILLETVGTSVNNYRRESQMIQTNGTIPGGRSSIGGHSRGASMNSTGGGSSVLDAVIDEHPGARNSQALDNLANELETLRTHWETTNKNHRFSDKSDIEKPMGDGVTTPPMSDGLASWRRKLDLEQSPQH